MKFLYNIIIIIIIIIITTIMIYTQLRLIACGVRLSIFSSSAQDLFTQGIEISLSASI
jgi:hypothetical protein